MNSTQETLHLIESLKKTFPARVEQITQLHELIGQQEDITPPTIFIHGPNASGKTTILKALFATPTHPIIDLDHVAYINCHEAFTPRQHQVKSCDTMDDFIVELKQCPESKKTRYLVFDNTEKLMQTCPGRFIPSLLKLAELTNLNLCVILISHLTWSDFSSCASHLFPVMIYFPPYTREEAIHIAVLDCPAEEPPAFYRQFAELLYSALKMSCRDVNEFRHVVQLLFPKFVEPVREGKATRDQISKLFGMVQGHVRQALHSLYLRDMSSADWIKKSEQASQSIQSRQFVKNSFDLPFYTKFLLISAFLASYNPPRLDNRYFTRGNDDKKRNRVLKNNGKSKTMKWRQQLLGPKVFPLERMLAIFYSICDDDIDPGFQLESQISTLVSLQLLTRSGSDFLENSKCKCNASYEFVKRISESVRFDLLGHLFDFVEE